MSPADTHRSPTASRSTRLLVALACAALVALAAMAVSATAQDLQSQVDSKQSSLDSAQNKQGVLTTEISRYDDQIDQLTGEVAALRTREAAVQAELDQAQAELREQQHALAVLRERLKSSVRLLERRLVAIYKSDEPDAVSVILNSEGFDDIADRYEYLQRIQDQDSDIVDRVRVLRDDKRATVEQVRTTRDSIRAKRNELARTREALEAKQADLESARAKSKDALSRINGHIDHLEGDISNIQDKIQAQLAAQAATTAPLPAGPVQGGSSGFIWPVNGPIVSGFGMRWGSMHEGVDIAVPAGTPIRAAKAGTIAFTQSEAESGGYGNYTCIDHGGGLSTCYAHQSSFAITSGSVEQGDVIGYVGCTGHCFGDHLHFEVRIGGAPTDPMAYL